MLTGYGNIATAVAAVKSGAVDYLSKPADADAVDAALRQLEARCRRRPTTDDRRPGAREHIQAGLRAVRPQRSSETARRLRMHRRPAASASSGKHARAPEPAGRGYPNHFRQMR